MDKLRNKAEGLVTQLTVKDECEKRVLDAVSNNKVSRGLKTYIALDLLLLKLGLNLATDAPDRRMLAWMSSRIATLLLLSGPLL